MRVSGSDVDCPTCAARLEPGFRFCPICGSTLAEQPIASSLERRTITALFCDLVDFSALSRQTDPEQLTGLLAQYFQIVRSEVVSHGALIEKYIGDAIVAIFGYPEAHDDDVERALHAALGIQRHLDEHNQYAEVQFRVHVGVHTGEAVIDLAASTSSGEGFAAGHAINLAQRLQSVSPAGSTTVSAAVYGRTRDRFHFSEQPPVRVKGEPDPLRNWLLTGARSTLVTDVLPLLGRDAEFAQLCAALEEAIASDHSRIVTVVGEPGIGKSRLVGELHDHAVRLGERVVWREGRCLPYGTGVTFSAVAEILKQDVGALDTDSVEVVRRKVAGAFAGKSDGARIASRLMPVLGVDIGDVDRDELFAAWADALMVMAGRHPAVVLVEDLHWADPGLRTFVEHLAADPLAVPLLVILTTRPELVRDAPSWPHPSSTTITLAPLDDDSIEQVTRIELGSTPIGEAERQLVLERSGGNPLFAREFARLMRDRAVNHDAVDNAGSAQVPHSIHALLAARLDTLSMVERGVVQCAAVFGKVFWSGAVAHVSRLDEERVTPVLDALVSNSIVRRRRTSSMAGQDEFAFNHLLMRDTAYERASRSWRRDAHMSAIQWIDATAGGRVDEVAEILAFHATSALDLAVLTDDATVAAKARPQAVRWSRVAAHRALMLDAHRALELLDVARALTAPGSSDEAPILLEWSNAAQAVNRVEEAAGARRLALELLRKGEDLQLLAEALVQYGDSLYQQNEVAAGLAADREAASIARSLPYLVQRPDPVANLALTLAALGDAEGLVVADEAERRAADVGQPMPLDALRARAMLRLQYGDPAGLEDHDEALRRMRDELRAVRSVASAMSVRADGVLAVHGPTAALAAIDETIVYANEHGLTNVAEWTSANRLLPQIDSGEVAYALVAARRAFERSAHLRVRDDALDAWSEAAVELQRGDDVHVLVPLCLDRVDELEHLLAEDPESAEVRVVTACRLAMFGGDLSAARRLMALLVDNPQALRTRTYGRHLTSLVRWALVAGRRDWATQFATLDRRDGTLRANAQESASAWLALAAGDVEQAAGAFRVTSSIWQSAGHRLGYSYCLVGLALALAAAGHPDAETAHDAAQRSRSAIGLPWPVLVPVLEASTGTHTA
jgi:class 3 adenylate cyclase